MPPNSPPRTGDKRKAKAEAKGAPKPKKMTKEEKAAARERARAAMDAAPPSAKKKKTAASKTPSKAKTTASKAGTAKKTGATVTIKEEVPVVKSDDAAAMMEMPLPPTSLQRTQSTPLELELEHQVKANLVADIKGETPVFKEAPPAHLLKFAPKELEEGYDHDESNAANIEDDPAEAVQQIPTPGNLKQQEGGKCPVHGFQFLLELAMIGISFYLFCTSGEGLSCIQRWTHGVVSHIPILPKNPYRINGKPVPYETCYSTNVDDPPILMRSECAGLSSTRCPAYAECYGGYLQACKGPYLELTSGTSSRGGGGKTCAMVPSVAKIYNHVVDRVSLWTLDYHCDIRNKKDSGSEAVKRVFADYPNSPRAYMSTKMHDTNPPTHQPLFRLDKILEEDPFLLMNAPEGGGTGRNPIQSLYTLLQEANKLVGNNWLKLQPITNYDKEIPDSDGRKEPTTILLVGRVPSKANWWRSHLSVRSQCSLLRMKISLEYGLRMPWLMGVCVVCMMLLIAWVFVTRHYWMQAQHQQGILATIEVVRGFVLQTLESDPSKTWKGSELLEYSLRNGPPSYLYGDDETIFRKRIWPRVVFDIRGDIRINQTVQMSQGCELIDLWNWIGEKPTTKPEATATKSS